MGINNQRPVPLPIADGGTNAITAQTAIDNILPSQTSKSGYILTTDGTNCSWKAETLPTSFTPVYRGANQSNVTILYALWWREGKFLNLDFHFEFTGQVEATASPWYIELPVVSSVQLNYDTTNANGGSSLITNSGRGHVGHCTWFQAGTAWKIIHACMDDASGGNVYRIRFAESPGYVTMNQLTTNAGNNSSIKSCFIRMPIVGW